MSLQTYPSEGSFEPCLWGEKTNCLPFRELGAAPLRAEAPVATPREASVLSSVHCLAVAQRAGGLSRWVPGSSSNEVALSDTGYCPRGRVVFEESQRGSRDAKEPRLGGDRIVRVDEK